MLKFLIFILIFQSILLGQVNKTLPSNKSESSTNFQLGIRDEIIIMFGYLENKKVQKSNLPINLHLTAGFKFLKNYKLDLRFGFLFINEDFWGDDIGIYLLADLFNTNFFTTAGIDHFNDFGTSHGSTNSGGDITFLCLGFGYNTSKNFNLDILYYIPDKRIFGADAMMGINMDETYYKIVDGLLKIGFQYSFLF